MRFSLSAKSPSLPIGFVYAAAVWALSFAAVSFYWALDGKAGIDTIAPGITELAAKAWFRALLWGTAIIKALGGLLVLSLAQPWRHPLRRLLARLIGLAGVLMILYGTIDLIQHGLMQIGVLPLSTALGARALHWYLLLWDLVWLFGGLLFMAAALTRPVRP